jgi:hypothetical protein
MILLAIFYAMISRAINKNKVTKIDTNRKNKLQVPDSNIDNDSAQARKKFRPLRKMDSSESNENHSENSIDSELKSNMLITRSQKVSFEDNAKNKLEEEEKQDKKSKKTEYAFNDELVESQQPKKVKKPSPE